MHFNISIFLLFYVHPIVAIEICFLNTYLCILSIELKQDVLPPDVFESLGPDFIAPVVAWLCHEECKVNLQVID